MCTVIALILSKISLILIYKIYRSMGTNSDRTPEQTPLQLQPLTSSLIPSSPPPTSSLIPSSHHPNFPFPPTHATPYPTHVHQGQFYPPLTQELTRVTDTTPSKPASVEMECGQDNLGELAQQISILKKSNDSLRTLLRLGINSPQS